MTIICAYREPGASETWIGSDGRSTMGDHKIMPTDRPKWHLCGSIAIGACGWDRVHGLIGRNRATFGSCVLSTVDRLAELIAKDDWNHDDKEGPKTWGASFIVADATGVWDVAQDFSIESIPAGTFWARGSGMDHALGAAYAAIEAGFGPNGIISVALRAACKFDATCGGTLFAHPWVPS